MQSHPDDEPLFWSLVDAEDDVLVEAALATLIRYYPPSERLDTLLRRLAWDDARDEEIRTLAIRYLADRAPDDDTAHQQLIAMAKSDTVNPFTQSTVIIHLAELKGLTLTKRERSELPYPESSTIARDAIRRVLEAVEAGEHGSTNQGRR